jgi:FixJ family two-component response regulator
MTNKLQAQQSAAEKDSEIEAITPKTLLRRFELYNKIVEGYRTKNIASGLDIKRANVYTPQTKLKQQERSSSL